MTYKEQMNDHIGFVERELEYSRQLHEKCKLYLSKEWHEHKRTCIEYFSKLEKENAELKAQNESLADTIISQNEQIEKMKCCGNCKHSYSVNTGGCYDTKCEFTGLDCTNCKDKWELA